MKVERLLLLSAMNAIVSSGPARRGCGETSTFVTTNLCGAPYSTTWVDCASGVTAFPTFFMPECTPPPAESTYIPDEPQWPEDAAITPTPSLADAIDPDETAIPDCMEQTVCVDAVKRCGEGDKRYGTCFNTCTEKGVLSTPTCEIEPTPTPTEVDVPGNHSHHHGDDPKPSFCADKPYMCKPTAW